MTEASTIKVRIPADLKHRIEMVAEKQGVSLNELAMYMFAREVSSFEAGNGISEYWKGYEKEEILQGFDDVMSKIKKRKVPKWDKA